jgi:hypothetical protein
MRGGRERERKQEKGRGQETQPAIPNCPTRWLETLEYDLPQHLLSPKERTGEGTKGWRGRRESLLEVKEAWPARSP